MKDQEAVSPAETSALATISVCVVMLMVAGLAIMVDERTLRGVSVWAKPVKFALSFGLHLATLLAFVRLTSSDVRKGRLVAAGLVAASLATLAEVLYVALQSARGRASHFNTDTPLEAFMYYQVMGGAALALVSATVLVGILVLLRPRPDIGPGLRLGAGWGAILGALATLVVAGALASGLVSGAGPWVGGAGTEAGKIPFFGWSRSAGDLRVPHFVATHLVQAMALAGWMADRLVRTPARRRVARLVVFAVAAFGLVMTSLAFVQALQGKPLLAA
jgi:hypothetical protein